MEVGSRQEGKTLNRVSSKAGKVAITKFSISSVQPGLRPLIQDTETLTPRTVEMTRPTQEHIPTDSLCQELDSRFQNFKYNSILIILFCPVHLKFKVSFPSNRLNEIKQQLSRLTSSFIRCQIVRTNLHFKTLMFALARLLSVVGLTWQVTRLTSVTAAAGTRGKTGDQIRLTETNKITSQVEQHNTDILSRFNLSCPQTPNPSD